MDTTDRFACGQTTVLTTATQIPVPKLPDGNRKGVLIKAHGDNDTAANTAPVFIGNSDQVTTTSGFSLAKGESITIPVEGDGVWAIASSNQAISWALA